MSLTTMRTRIFFFKVCRELTCMSKEQRFEQMQCKALYWSLLPVKIVIDQKSSNIVRRTVAWLNLYIYITILYTWTHNSWLLFLLPVSVVVIVIMHLQQINYGTRKNGYTYLQSTKPETEWLWVQGPHMNLNSSLFICIALNRNLLKLQRSDNAYATHNNLHNCCNHNLDVSDKPDRIISFNCIFWPAANQKHKKNQKVERTRNNIHF